jgi:hypothetical protein
MAECPFLALLIETAFERRVHDVAGILLRVRKDLLVRCLG